MSKTESPDAMFKATVLLKGPKKFRRAGVGFVQGEQVITVTQTQLDAINADPMLKVLEVADAPPDSEAESEKAPPSSTRQNKAKTTRIEAVG